MSDRSDSMSAAHFPHLPAAAHDPGAPGLQVPAMLDTRAIDPKALGKVAVLMGGRSAEREISLLSGAGVLAALRAKGVDAHAFDPAARTLQELRTDGYARAFIALHGRYGEDGTVQGALELLDLPYTGSGVMASAIGVDKVRTKHVWLSQGLPTPRFVVVSNPSQLDALPEYLGLPLIMKPPREGSSIGVSKVKCAEQLIEAYALAARHDREVLAEEMIDGPELTVSIVGSGEDARALPVIEIRAPGGNYDYQNKYFTDDTQYLCPAPLSATKTREIQRIALSAYKVLGCEGWGRVDFMLARRDDKPYLIEVNTSPGMTGHSLVPLAARTVGVAYEDLVLAITAQASLKIGAHAGGRKQ